MDNIGLKLTFVDVEDTRGLRSMRQEAIDSKRKLPVLDALFQFIESSSKVSVES